MRTTEVVPATSAARTICPINPSVIGVMLHIEDDGIKTGHAKDLYHCRVW